MIGLHIPFPLSGSGIDSKDSCHFFKPEKICLFAQLPGRPNPCVYTSVVPESARLQGSQLVLLRVQASSCVFSMAGQK